MALGIPLPSDMGEALLKGVNTGSGMFSRLMQPILEREKMAQQAQQFEQELALRKAAAGRAGANADLNRQILQQQLLGLQHANDPMYGMNQVLSMQKLLGGGGNMPQENMPMPTQETGEGMGMFLPETLGNMQSPMQTSMQPNMQTTPPPNNGINFELLKQNPMMRAFVKKQLGYDPLAAVPQTPEEKQKDALELYRQKENIKAQNKGGEAPTNAVLTQNQQAIQGIDTVIPMLDELINDPDKVYGIWDFSPSKKAAYNAKTSGMIDTLVAAQSLPKVQASIDLVEQQIRRATNESDDAYIKRIENLKEDLVNRRGKAQSVIQSRKVNTAALPPTVYETKNINGKTYQKINGEWHEV